MRNNLAIISREKKMKIAVKVHFNQVYIQRPKGLKGHKWNQERKCWFFPKSDNIIEQLIDIFKTKNLWIDPSLKEENKILFNDLLREMVSRKYSPKTIKAYINYNNDFLKFTSKTPNNIAERNVKDYLFHLAEEMQVATSTLNCAINAMKFYYGTFLKKYLFYKKNINNCVYSSIWRYKHSEFIQMLAVI